MITWIALLLVPKERSRSAGRLTVPGPWIALGVVPLLAIALAAPDDPLGSHRPAAPDHRLVRDAREATSGRDAAPVPEARRRRDDDHRLGVHLRRPVGRPERRLQRRGACRTPAAPGRWPTSATSRPSTATTSSRGGRRHPGRRTSQSAARRGGHARRAQTWNQLFAVVDSLPGTVPPTAVMLRLRRPLGPRPRRPGSRRAPAARRRRQGGWASRRAQRRTRPRGPSIGQVPRPRRAGGPPPPSPRTASDTAVGAGTQRQHDQRGTRDQRDRNRHERRAPADQPAGGAAAGDVDGAGKPSHDAGGYPGTTTR